MSTLHKLQEYIETATEKDDISEDAYLKITNHLKNLNSEISDLNNKIKLLDNESRLDLVELLLDETRENMEAAGFECVYHDLTIEQFKKLRYPFE